MSAPESAVPDLRRAWRWAGAGAPLGWTVSGAAQTSGPNILSPLERPLTRALAQSGLFPYFWLDHVGFLRENQLLSVPLYVYLASGTYVLLAFLSAKLIDWLLSDWLRHWAARTKTRLDGPWVGLLHGPIKIVTFVIFLHIGLRIYPLSAWLQDYCSKALRLVVAWSLTYMALKAVDLLIEYWRRRLATDEDRAFNDQFLPLIRKSSKVFVGVVAVLLTAQNLDLNITSLLASLSVGGLALGLAAQDTIANLFGAVAIFLDKPFHLGERVKLDGVDGVVETIGLRSTRVRNADGHLITIPNKTMGNAIITNVSRQPTIKTEINFGLTYDTSLDKLRRAIGLLEQVYKSDPMTADVIVTFNKFGDSALNLQVVHYWKPTDYKRYLAGLQALNLQIKERFEAERIDLAFPTQTLYVKPEAATA